MKKICLGLSAALLLSGCISTKPPKTQATATNVRAVAEQNLIQDPQFTAFRKDKGESKYWKRINPKNKGIGNAGSSGSTAFDRDGCARFRFMEATDDFTAQPGLYQVVKGLEPNTDYELSLYYNDKKGKRSPSKLVFGVEDKSGDEIAAKEVHVSELKTAPKSKVSRHFKQTFVTFNSGSNTQVKVFAKLKITDPSKIKLDRHIGSETEVRIDEVILMKDK